MDPTMIKATPATMRHIKNGLDVVGDDIAEMVRRLTHPGGRKGYRSRSLESGLGIPGYPAEEVVITLDSATNGNRIIVQHFLTSASKVTITVDNQLILRVPGREIADLPETIKASIPGQRLGQLVDLSGTSLADLAQCRIASIYGNSDGSYSIYVDGPVDTIKASALLEFR